MLFVFRQFEAQFRMQFQKRNQIDRSLRNSLWKLHKFNYESIFLRYCGGIRSILRSQPKFLGHSPECWSSRGLLRRGPFGRSLRAKVEYDRLFQLWDFCCNRGRILGFLAYAWSSSFFNGRGTSGEPECAWDLNERSCYHSRSIADQLFSTVYHRVRGRSPDWKLIGNLRKRFENDVCFWSRWIRSEFP